ncbi:MAG TPA: response regulator [Candidatus Binataceae bacterium]|nr:response regulator [Candidatus Binataceae bacterium]
MASTTLFDYATFRPLVCRRGWEMGEFGPSPNARVLILEEAAAACHLANVLINAGFSCQTASSIGAALAVIETRGAEVIICPARTETINGADFLRIVAERRVDLPLILLAEDPSVPAAVAAMRQGAFDGSVLI